MDNKLTLNDVKHVVKIDLVDSFDVNKLLKFLKTIQKPLQVRVFDIELNMIKRERTLKTIDGGWSYDDG